MAIQASLFNALEDLALVILGLGGILLTAILIASALSIWRWVRGD